ncbi:MAG: hypothetical protein JO235_09610 [Chroococcidiopsidaceae cyanobacterium CP_BM_RX_35]|nr:hypothetical protein [Chroococcidiopsidaceae cyanobacterium CP_BM_RX_35]
MRTCLLTAILLGLLTACGIGGLEPSRQVVQQGLAKFNEVIALQLSQTQQQPSFKIKHLVIAEQQSLVVQDLSVYRVRGTYDLTIMSLKRRQTQQHNSFELYLQRQKEGKTWRLLLPQSTGKDSTPVWLSYSI